MPHLQYTTSATRQIKDTAWGQNDLRADPTFTSPVHTTWKSTKITGSRRARLPPRAPTAKIEEKRAIDRDRGNNWGRERSMRIKMRLRERRKKGEEKKEKQTSPASTLSLGVFSYLHTFPSLCAPEQNSNVCSCFPYPPLLSQSLTNVILTLHLQILA